MTNKSNKPPKVSDQLILYTILSLCQDAGTDGNVKPETVAQAILPGYWQTLTKRVRLIAKQQAIGGNVHILRKGKPVDPDDFKGLIRLQITPEGAKLELVHPEEEKAARKYAAASRKK